MFGVGFVCALDKPISSCCSLVCFVCEEEPCFVFLLTKQTEEEGDLRIRRIETVCVCVYVFFWGFGWVLRITDDDDAAFWITEAFGQVLCRKNFEELLVSNAQFCGSSSSASCCRLVHAPWLLCFLTRSCFLVRFLLFLFSFPI